jgi:hypothetical protein
VEKSSADPNFFSFNDSDSNSSQPLGSCHFLAVPCRASSVTLGRGSTSSASGQPMHAAIVTDPGEKQIAGA